MSWSSALLAFLVSHCGGDVLFQTDWQAQNKAGGLGNDKVARRALSRHVATYTMAFVPALAWIGKDKGMGRAASVGSLIAAPHLIIDDGRLVAAWTRRVKQASESPAAVLIAVDQSFHVLSLLGAAMAAAR
jgi:hypothetical protein